MNVIILNPASYTIQKVVPTDSLFSLVETCSQENLEKGYKVILNNGFECILYKGYDDSLYIIYPTDLINQQEMNQPVKFAFTFENYALFIVTDVDKKILYDHTVEILEEK